MNIFLVDYENVSISGLDGTKLLKKKDKIYIFYSIKAKDVSMDIIDNLMKSKADFKLFKLTKTAKNALDFQLVLFLGTRLKKYGKKAKYHIISADNGYQSSIDFAKEYFRIEINKAESIKEAIEGKPPKLLLEDNSKNRPPVPSDANPIVDEIFCKLKLDPVLNDKMVEAQMKSIARIIVDKSKNTEELAVQSIASLLGKSKVDLIPIIFRHYSTYLQFVPKAHTIRESVERKLMSDVSISKCLNQAQFRQISALLSNATKVTKEVASEKISGLLGKDRQYILPSILECCKEYIED